MSDGSIKTEAEPLGAGRLDSRRVSPHVVRVRLCVALLSIDLFSILLAFLGAMEFRHLRDGWYSVMIVTMAIYFGTALNSGAYGTKALRDATAGGSVALRSLFFAFAALFLISYFFRIEQDLSRLALLATMALAAVLLLVLRRTLASLIRRHWAPLLVDELVLDAGGSSVALPGYVRRVDAIRAQITPDLRDPVMMDRFAALVRGVDRIVIASPPEQRQNWAMMLKGANVLGEILVDDLGNVGAFGLGRMGAYNTLTVSAGSLSLEQRIVKRAFDLALCIPIVITLIPVLLLIAIAIKLDSKGPIFFRQRRVGRGNAFFEILKFRSMHVEHCDADGRVSTQRGDSRITRVGRFIRQTSIDELPQLLNVLGGSMSLVGPRPHALGSLAGEHLFWDVDERYWHRHVLKPGITGLAQVRGFRGATHHRDDLANRLEADLEYTADWSVFRDIGIIVATFKVLVHKNTY